jgi:hypothetical protein
VGKCTAGAHPQPKSCAIARIYKVLQRLFIYAHDGSISTPSRKSQIRVSSCALRGKSLPGCHSRFWVVETAYLAYLIVHAGEVPEAMADRFNGLPEGGIPVMVGDHAELPYPEAFLGIQLGLGAPGSRCRRPPQRASGSFPYDMPCRLPWLVTGGTEVVGDMFNRQALPSTGSRLLEQVEHVSRPYLAQTPALDLAMGLSHVSAPPPILPLNTCSVCSTATNAAPTAGVDVYT